MILVPCLQCPSTSSTYPIKTCSFQLVDICYKNVGKRYIAIGKSKEWYCNDSEECNADCFTADEVKELICVLLKETYVQFAGFIFQWIKGIPMGGSASAQIADLTLSIM